MFMVFCGYGVIAETFSAILKPKLGFFLYIVLDFKICHKEDKAIP